MKNQEDEDGMARDEHTEKDSTAADQPVVVTDKSKLEKKKREEKTLVFPAKASYSLSNKEQLSIQRPVTHWARKNIIKTKASYSLSSEKHYQNKGQLLV